MKSNHTVSGLTALAILFALTGSASADGWSIFGHDHIRGSGNITTQKRDVSDFERIHLDCSADLNVTIGDTFQVSVTTDDNLQDNIVTEVSGRRTLVITSEESFSSHRGVRVEITVPGLSMLEVGGSGDVYLAGLNSESLEIELGGSGDVELDGQIKNLRISIAGSGSVASGDLAAETVRIEMSGSGNVDLRGKTTEIDCMIAGSGDIDAAGLEAAIASAEVRGSGDISVFAQDSFEGRIFGSGDIDVYGNPEDDDRNIAGSGSIRRHR